MATEKQWYVKITTNGRWYFFPVGVDEEVATELTLLGAELEYTTLEEAIRKEKFQGQFASKI